MTLTEEVVSQEEQQTYRQTKEFRQYVLNRTRAEAMMLRVSLLGIAGVGFISLAEKSPVLTNSIVSPPNVAVGSLFVLLASRISYRNRSREIDQRYSRILATRDGVAPNFNPKMEERGSRVRAGIGVVFGMGSILTIASALPATQEPQNQSASSGPSMPKDFISNSTYTNPTQGNTVEGINTTLYCDFSKSPNDGRYTKLNGNLYVGTNSANAYELAEGDKKNVINIVSKNMFDGEVANDNTLTISTNKGHTNVAVNLNGLDNSPSSPYIDRASGYIPNTYIDYSQSNMFDYAIEPLNNHETIAVVSCDDGFFKSYISGINTMQSSK